MTKKITTFIGLGTALLLSSCSMNEQAEELGNSNLSFELTEKTLEDIEPGFYTRSVVFSDSDWEICPLGCGVCTPYRYLSYDGKLWRDRLVGAYYSAPFTDILWGPLMLLRNQGVDKEFFVASRIDYDDSEKSFILPWENSTFECKADGNFSITINCNHVENHPEIVSVIDYKKTETNDIRYEKFLFFETRLEADLAIINMAREMFGNEFDPNDYADENVVFTSTFNLDEFEQLVREYYNKDIYNM